MSGKVQKPIITDTSTYKVPYGQLTRNNETAKKIKKLALSDMLSNFRKPADKPSKPEHNPMPKPPHGHGPKPGPQHGHHVGHNHHPGPGHHIGHGFPPPHMHKPPRPDNPEIAFRSNVDQFHHLPERMPHKQGLAIGPSIFGCGGHGFEYENAYENKWAHYEHAYDNYC